MRKSLFKKIESISLKRIMELIYPYMRMISLIFASQLPLLNIFRTKKLLRTISKKLLVY